MELPIHSIVFLTFYTALMITTIIAILNRFKSINNIWKKSIHNKIDEIYQSVGTYNASTLKLVEIVNKFNTNVETVETASNLLKNQLSEIKLMLDNINYKVNILEDELSNNIRGKLYKLVVLGTRGFNTSLEPEKTFLSYLLDRNINDLADAVGRLIKNVELINDHNFKVSVMGNTKSYLKSCYIGTNINDEPCGYPDKFIHEIVELQSKSFDSFTENFKLGLSLNKDIKEVALINLYREFEDYIDKACICFERNSKEIKDVEYLKQRYPDSKYLIKNGHKCLELTTDEINRDLLLDYLTRGDKGVKKVFALLKNTKDLEPDFLNSIINLNNQFTQVTSDKLLGLDAKESEKNRIVLALTTLIQENL